MCRHSMREKILVIWKNIYYTINNTDEKYDRGGLLCEEYNYI